MTMFENTLSTPIARTTFNLGGRFFTCSTVCLGKHYHGRFETMLFVTGNAEDIGDEVESKQSTSLKDIMAYHHATVNKWVDALNAHDSVTEESFTIDVDDALELMRRELER